jgi:adenylylsulfate kinase
MARHQPLSGGLSPAAGKPGFAVWLTGPPASGKSTLALELQRLLAGRGLHAVVLDSDDLRRMLTPRPTYTDAERDWFYAVVAGLAAWLTGSGVNVLIAATGHKRAYRQRAREQIQRLAEVYVQCAPDICRQRDPKGLYAFAQAGRAPRVPGLGVDYEAPLNPVAVVDTGRLSPAAAAAAVLAELQQQGFASDQA